MLIRMVRVAAVLALLALAACVERRLLVRTDPPGAEVRVNGDVVGRSPAVWRFDHYGTVLVEADLPGYLPAQQAVDLRAPLYQAPVVDFFADVLLPARVRDEHEVALRLEPEPELSPRRVEREVSELTRAADKWRKAAEASR